MAHEAPPVPTRMSPLPLGTLRFLLVFPILATAAAFLALSLSVIVRNAPIVVRASLLAWLVTISAGSLLLAAIVFLFSSSGAAGCMLVALPALIIYSAWRSMRGFMVVGVADKDLRNALRASLAGLELPFEESMLGFALSSLGDNLQVRFHSQLATAQIRMGLRGHSQELAQIAQRVRDHLRVNGEAQTGAVLFYGAAGLACLALALYQAQRF